MQVLLLKIEQVQEIDVQISIIRRKIADLPKRLASYDVEIQDYTAKTTDKTKILDEVEKNLRQQRGAIELSDSRLKRSQEKLTLIKTNQEYQALQKEIESLKKNTAIIQENANKVQVEVDQYRKEISDIAELSTRLNSQREQEASKITEEESVLCEDLNQFEKSRGELIRDIEPRYLSMYERIRDARFGIGIVRAVGGSCKGCNMRIPPQVYNEIQRGNEIHACPSCKRILFFYKEPTESSFSSASASNH